MKAKHAFFLFIAGYCLDFLGGLLKILHTSDANMILVIGTVLKIIGALLLVYKIALFPKFKEFMNS